MFYNIGLGGNKWKSYIDEFDYVMKVRWEVMHGYDYPISCFNILFNFLKKLFLYDFLMLLFIL